jgi:serine/threonine-protein kinase RsbW
MHKDSLIGSAVQFELSLRSEVGAIPPFVDSFIRLIRKCGGIPVNEEDIEMALREALVNAVVHGNHEDSGKLVFVSCRCGIDEISIVIRDQGQGFALGEVPNPTDPEHIQSSHGRGIYLMKATMDEVRFERGGAVVYLRKSARKNPPSRTGNGDEDSGI